MIPRNPGYTQLGIKTLDCNPVVLADQDTPAMNLTTMPPAGGVTIQNVPEPNGPLDSLDYKQLENGMI